MSSRQTSTQSPNQTPEGTEPQTHWSEDADFQWRAATELLIALGVPRSTARLTSAPGRGRRPLAPRRQAPS